MVNFFLAATETVKHIVDEASLVQKFGIEPRFVIMQVVSFLILFGTLYWFGIKPTIAMIEVRNKKIAAGLRDAEEMQAKLAATQKESAAIIRSAQLEADKLIAEANKTAKKFGDKQRAEATASAVDKIAKAQQTIELKHKKMIEEVRGEIAHLVIATTERVLAKKLSDADRAAYNDTVAKELASV